MRERLPCGCVRGEYLCQEAEHLWARAAHFFCMSREADFNDESWAEYLEVLTNYKRHFGRDD